MAASDTLLERERELAELTELVDRAADGHGTVALIEGPAGIGKTRLLAEVRSAGAAVGARTLTARGSELEREFPFGAVRQLFEATVLEAGQDPFAGAAGPARAVFGTPEGQADASPDSAFAALHGLFWLVLNVTADRPLVLLIDDLHWCDRPSLRFFAYLVRRLEGVPLLMAVTVRSTEPGTDPALLAEIAADPATVSVRPAPLSGEAAAMQVRERLGAEADARFCKACHDTTNGNPLLLTQLLSSLAADGVRPEAGQVDVVSQLGPRAVTRTVLLRLSRLQPEAVPVARAVAVLGESADLTAVARHTDLDERMVGEAVGALARAEILRAEPPLGFVHPLVRDAVYHELPQGERELEHARAAELLVESGAEPEQVAAHLLSVPRRGDPGVVERLRSAAYAAGRKGGGDSAVHYLRRALEEPPPDEVRNELLLELGLTETHSDGAAAAAHLEEAYNVLREPLPRVLAAVALARTWIFMGNASGAAELCVRARRNLPPELEDMSRALLALELVTYYFGFEPEGFEEKIATLADWQADGSRPGAAMLTALASHHEAQVAGDRERSLALALESLRTDELMASDNGLFWVSAALSLTYSDRDDAMDVWDRALAGAHLQGSLFGALSVHLWRGYTLLERGQLPEARDSLNEAFHGMVSWGFNALRTLSYPSGFMARTLLEMGDLDGAEEVLNSVQAAQGFNNGEHAWRCARCELHLARGDWDQALDSARDLEANLGLIKNPAWAPWRTLTARALAGLGRTDEAAELAEAEVEVARGWGAPRALGRALRILGQVRGDEEPLREAVDVLDGSTAQLELAKALVALGAFVRRNRRPSEARDPLRRALELADSCGAAPVADQARTELYASGSRPRTEAMSGVGSLTASERRVADLAVDGRTNRDIAQTLFVTPKTVEVHLTNAYRKLGIRSRRELPGVLAA